MVLRKRSSSVVTIVELDDGRIQEHNFSDRGATRGKLPHRRCRGIDVCLNSSQQSGPSMITE
jgi:hypothetical protein